MIPVNPYFLSVMYLSNAGGFYSKSDQIDATFPH